jgi:hypothetical protein
MIDAPPKRTFKRQAGSNSVEKAVTGIAPAVQVQHPVEADWPRGNHFRWLALGLSSGLRRSDARFTVAFSASPRSEFDEPVLCHHRRIASARSSRRVSAADVSANRARARRG